MRDAEERQHQGKWTQFNALMIASNTKEIMVDEFVKSNPNAVRLCELAYKDGF